MNFFMNAKKLYGMNMGKAETIIGGVSLKISRLIIKNYRNLEEIDIHLNDTVALIGENNSGKSNFLRALTFPFLSEEEFESKCSRY